MLPLDWLNRKPTAQPAKAAQASACAARRSFGPTVSRVMKSAAKTSAVRKPNSRFQPVMGPP